MQMVHGVSSALTLWHKACIVAKGDEIRVWCDGRPLTVARRDLERARICRTAQLLLLGRVA